MTHGTVVQGPPTPPAPAVPTPGVTIVTQGALSSPVTRQDVSALLARKKMLSDQVNSATARRKDVARQLRSATGADRAGLEQRLTVLDARIARLEADIDETGKQLSAAPVAIVAEQQEPILGWGPTTNNRLSDNAAPLLGLLIIFVLFPVALSLARMVWKRTSRQQVQPPIESRRLERMEQAIEAVAIEVERISEGQRFVTRLLSESKDLPAAQSDAKAEPLGIARPNRAPH